MTDRVNRLLVTLDRDMRDDDVESVMRAIRMNRFVCDVTYENCVTDPRDHAARQQVRHDLADTIRVVCATILKDYGVPWVSDKARVIEHLEHALDKVRKAKDL